MSKHYHQHAPVPPAPSPAPAAKPDVFGDLLKLGGVALAVVGAITLAAPWLRGGERAAREAAELRRLPPPGWTCWTVETSGGSHRGCEPARGWHLERWPGAGEVSVPDYAPGRYRVSDYR